MFCDKIQAAQGKTPGLCRVNVQAADHLVSEKNLTIESIPSALKKAERYRLLNEPIEAESICLDILQVGPDNQETLIMLLLAYTDKFRAELYPAFNKAVSVIERLRDEISKASYRGVIYERRVKAHMNQSGPSSDDMAQGWFTKP